MVAERCLICYQDGIPSSSSSTSKHYEDFPSSIALISKELHAMFILRNIFEVPRESIEEYLGTGTNPSEWINLCSNCKSFMEKAKRIYKEMLDASKKFRKVKGDIIQYLRRNKRRVQGQGQHEKKGGKWSKGLRVTDETRMFVSEHNYSESLVDPFVGGDCQAEKLLYSSNVTVTEINDDIIFHADDVKIEGINLDDWDYDNDNEDDEDGVPTSPQSNCSFSNDDQGPQSSRPRSRPSAGHRSSKKDSVIHEDRGPVENSDGQVQWYCSCGRSYSGSEKLRRHLREANMEITEMFNCPICDKRFKRNWDVKRHMKHHTGSDNIKVTSVRGGVSSVAPPTKTPKQDVEDDEEDSSMSSFPPPPSVEVPSSGSGANSNASRTIVHESKDVTKMADGTEYWNCSCGKIYLAEITLRQHVNESNTELSTKITCPICDRTFKMRFDRNRHMKKEHGMETAAVQQEKEPVKDNPQDNIEFERQDQEDFEEYFEASDSRDSTFGGDGGGDDKHKELGLYQTADGTEQWNCLCGKSYASQGALHRHVKEKNMDPNKWVSCHYCGKSFKRQSELKRHVGNVHEKKSFPCENCGKTFTQRTNLRVHQRSKCSGGEEEDEQAT